MRRNNNNNNNNTNNMWISPQKQLIWRKQDRFHVPNILKSGAFRLQIQNWIQSAFFFFCKNALSLNNSETLGHFHKLEEAW